MNALGDIYCCNARFNARFNAQTQNWDSIPGKLNQIAVASDGAVWGLNAVNHIYRFDAATHGWELMPGALTQLAAGADAVVSGVNSAHEADGFWRSGSEPPLPEGALRSNV